MTRPRKRVVDYFPHYCKPDRTLFIIENKFGNNGYAFWYKLREALGETEGHVIDVSNDYQLETLAAKSGISGSETLDILSFMSRIGVIDRDLWMSLKLIWCQGFVDDLSRLYDKRADNTPRKPDIIHGNYTETIVSDPETIVSGIECPYKRKGKERKGKETPSTDVEGGLLRGDGSPSSPPVADEPQPASLVQEDAIPLPEGEKTASPAPEGERTAPPEPDGKKKADTHLPEGYKKAITPLAGGREEGEPLVQGQEADGPPPEGEKTASPSSKGKKRTQPRNDTEWLAKLREDPAYRGMDVDREYHKMVRWCGVNGKIPSRKRLINWLNRVEIPMDGGNHGGSAGHRTPGKPGSGTVDKLVSTIGPEHYQPKH